ncbi:FG-GAP-like repeat-containing protein [Kitasatospora sp. DSM 101779]|uniref:FG-GAP-like repeat-containing protein n=1 Tax=Kitasatospora sp. DSM 101779 TaxID=2853165 RepID=UPI0021DAFF27|nr:FG-GAP-like repeat-containing protein [Kitasatospora sp. DSM 101779]MCU7823135.1 VCBS repeat-containing protein [Kitasatospora sp. DSM 101779]
MPPSTSRRALAAALGATLTALTLTAAIPAQADTAKPQPSAKQTTGPLTAEQASSKAKSSKKGVVVEAATTPTDELTANPDGSFTLKQAVTPVRKYQDGGWKSLDATLVKQADGSIAPKVTSSDLTFSGGGSGPLAEMKSGNRSLSLSLPAALVKNLPSPALEGPTATYKLLAGVDLKVTADPQGGFSEVLVVKDAAAAANPALKSLSFTTKATGVDLGTDAAGNITGKDKHGKVAFSAPAPVRGVWDSAADTSVPTVTDPTNGKVLDARSGSPARSSVAGPGATAHTAPLKAEYKKGAITLTPDSALLSGKDTVWPLYIDPSYSAGGSALGWTYVSSAFPTTSYWKTTDATGLRVGYNNWESPYYVGRAFARMSVPNSIYGAQVSTSTFYATETWAPSCSGRDVELWKTDAISSSTTWNNQPGWTSKSATKNVANGYSSGCPAASVGFDTTGLMQSAANGNWADITLGLRASNESDGYGWKKFQPSSMYMSTTYNHAPTTPTTLTTSPATSCTAATPTVVGNGDVMLRAAVSDPDGGSLGVAFSLVKTSTGAVVASSTTSGLKANSGTTAQLLVGRQALVTAAGGAATTFSWNVYTNDDSVNSGTSATCKFTFDPTAPGKPTADVGSGPFTVGTPAQVTISANPVGTVPASYVYQLNGAAPSTVAAVSGAATVSIKPTRAHNVLTVTALSAGGNPSGDSEVVELDAAPPAPAPENDLTGDGRADLAAVGGQSALPAGLWLASGATDKSLNTAADNLGSEGTAGSTPSPADWTGTQAIVGHFRSGSGFNDVLQYNPATGAGLVLYGNGDGSALSPLVGKGVPSVAFTSPATSAKATWVANAGQLYTTAAQGEPNPFPSLLSILDGSLYLQPTTAQSGGFFPAEVDLSDTNPTGTGTWAGWTIVTALGSDGMPGLFARSDAGGQLYYFSSANLLDLTLGNGATPALLASTGWTKAARPALQAADIDRNGTLDLWSVDANGAASANLFNGTTISGQSAQTLITATHSWALDDNATEGAAVTAAADRTGSLNLTGQAGATWSSKDLFSPDVRLNGTSTGVLSSSTPALDVSKSFSVSVWAKPDNAGGVLLSQDGNSTSGFMLYPDGGTNQWYFCLAKVDSGWSYDCVHAGVGTYVQPGAWTHLTATYNSTSGVMALYINGIVVNSTPHTAVSGFTKGFRVGDYFNVGTHQSFYKGSVSNVQVWAGTALTPSQAALLSGTPGYVLFPSDDTNYPSGTTWSAGNARMRFDGGQLIVSNPGYGTWTLGTNGHTGAVLTLQPDGNLVSYPQAAHTTGTALWGTNTYNAPGDVMFFQPDGNLVIYKSDGAAIWASDTYSRGRRSAGTESGGNGKVRWGDFDGDRKPDAIIISDTGAISVKLNNGGDGHGGWTDFGQVATGVTSDRTKVRFADWDGDGKTDYLVFSATGAVSVYLNKGGDGHGGWTSLGQVTYGTTSNPDQVRFADFDGDGKTDYISIATSGATDVYINKGGDGRGGFTALGQVALGVTSDRTRIRWADQDGDGKADYSVINGDGSVTTYINKGGDVGGGWFLRSKITSGTTTDQNVVNFADINGDNRLDYLVTNGATTARLSDGGDDFATPGWLDWGQILGTV